MGANFSDRNEFVFYGRQTFSFSLRASLTGMNLLSIESKFFPSREKGENTWQSELCGNVSIHFLSDLAHYKEIIVQISMGTPC